MNPSQRCGALDALMVDKEAQAETTKVGNNEKLCRKVKVLENDSSSKNKVASITTKWSDVVWNNDEAIIDRIFIVKKSMAAKKKALKEKARLDSNSQGHAHNLLNVADIFEENGVEEDS